MIKILVILKLRNNFKTFSNYKPFNVIDPEEFGILSNISALEN